MRCSIIILCSVLLGTLLPFYSETVSRLSALLILAAVATQKPCWRVGLLCFVFFALRGLLPNAQAPLLEQEINCRAQLLIDDFPVQRGLRQSGSAVLRSACPPLPVGMKVHFSHYEAPLRIHQSISANLRTYPPHAESSVPQRWKERQNPWVNLKNIHLIEQQDVSFLARSRAAWSARLDRVFSPQAAKWLQAMLLGNRQFIQSDDHRVLRATGTSHLIAISGLHLGIIAALIYAPIFALAVFFRPIHRRVEPHSLALLAAMFLAGLYAFFVGASPSVLRAWLMLCASVLGWFFGKKEGALHGLCFAAIIMLLWQPLTLFSLSAWLSFLATSCVLMVIGTTRSPLLDWLRIQCHITLGLLPIIWAVFGGISLYSLAVNWMIIPWLPVYLFTGLLGLLFPALAFMHEVCSHLLFSVIQRAALLPAAWWQPNVQPSLLQGALLFLAYFTLLHRHFRFSIALLLTAVLLWMLPPASVYRAPLSTPLAVLRDQEHCYIINAGMRNRYYGSDQAERYILPYLRRHRLHPDAIILTRNTSKHASALITLQRAYPNTPIYTLDPRKHNDIPWPLQLCPETLPGWEHVGRCRLRHISTGLEVSSQGIESQ